MLKIIAHRGLWAHPCNKNSEDALGRAFKNGFGVETDIRDLNGTLVISHDPPTGNPFLFEAFLQLYICNCKETSYTPNEMPLALNIKSDGLAQMVRDALKKHKIHNYFVFDMSVPDLLIMQQEQLVTFTRLSEYEPVPSLYENAAGVWLDCFNKEWYDMQTIQTHLDAGKQVCIVSPELHKRQHMKLWKNIKESTLYLNTNLLLCTDLPLEAQNFFGD
ncbi:MAG: hypothetical protein JXX14_24920 [Deltaproteobacteria bacterium]|nr:hypothetical protein [Deltaproteobacteria bacterium]